MFRIHVWPSAWGLPSLDPLCLSVILYCQLTYPGYYEIVECVDPDTSPTGQLPFLTHGINTIAGTAPIFHYLSKLDLKHEPHKPRPVPKLDGTLTELELSQRAAWRAAIEAHLGDLLAHSFYVLKPNYAELTRPTLAGMMPFPSRYYVPDRIRDSWQPRLKSKGLWLEVDEEEPIPLKKVSEKEEAKEEFRKAFHNTKVLEKAGPSLGIMAKLLGDRSFIFQDRPTTLDLVLASYILLLIDAPLPNRLVPARIEENFPTLVNHARLIFRLAFKPEGDKAIPTPVVIKAPHTNPLSSLGRGFFQVIAHPFGATRGEPSEVEKSFQRWRWGFAALAGVGAVGYVSMLLARGIVTVRFASAEDRALEGSDEEEEEETS